MAHQWEIDPDYEPADAIAARQTALRLIWAAEQLIENIDAAGNERAAVEAVTEVSEVGLALVNETMRIVRGRGTTWQTIADVYGVSRSAAQQRFGHLDRRDGVAFRR